MAWQIVVESDDGNLETVGERSEDLDELAVAALSLADELGCLTVDMSLLCTVHIMSDSGSAVLSIKALPGGLNPT